MADDFGKFFWQDDSKTKQKPLHLFCFHAKTQRNQITGKRHTANRQQKHRSPTAAMLPVTKTSYHATKRASDFQSYRESEKVLQRSRQTSAEKSGKFCREVGKVHTCSCPNGRVLPANCTAKAYFPDLACQFRGLFRQTVYRCISLIPVLGWLVF